MVRRIVSPHLLLFPKSQRCSAYKEHSFFIFILYKITLLSGAFFSLSRFWRTQERLCIMNRVRSFLSMRCMLLGYCFEPRPYRRALGTEGSVMTIGLSMNGCSYSKKKKTDWGEKTRLTSPEVLAAVASKAWRDSCRTFFSLPHSKTLLAGQPRTLASSRYSSYQRRLGTQCDSEFSQQAWQVTSDQKSPRTTGNEAARGVV